MGSRRFSSAASVASISSASVFSPSIAPSVKSGGHQPLIPGSASVGGGNNTLGGGGGGDGGSTALAGGHGLQPSSARLLRDLNNSARSSLLSSLGTAASRTFRSYKMTLPRCPPPVKSWTGSTTSIGGSGSVRSTNNKGGGNNFTGSSGAIAASNSTMDNEDEITLESDLELLGRTVHAVSSALTEPSKENDKFMIYDVSFNPKGCVWDALIVVQLSDDDDDNGEEKSDDNSASQRSSSRGDGDNNGERRQRDRSTSRHSRRGSSSSRHGRSSSRRRHRSSSRSHHRSVSRSSKRPGGSHGSSYDGMMMDGKKTFSFPIRVTCAEDDVGGSGSGELDITQQQQNQHRSRGQGPHPKRAKTYAVDLAVIDDMPHHAISSWSTSEAAEHRDDIKNAVEWLSYGIRRSMARSMFPQFPEGCQGRPFREIYQLNKKVSFFMFIIIFVIWREEVVWVGRRGGKEGVLYILFFLWTNN